MNSHEKADGRRILVGLWLDWLKEADERQRASLDRLLEESGGEPVSTPHWEIRGPSRDMLRVLVEGLEAALDGKKDPFGFKPNGRPHQMNRHERIDVLVEFFKKVSPDRGRASDVNDLVSAQDHAASCAPATISENTVKAWLKEKDLVGMALLRLDDQGFDTELLHDRFFRGKKSRRGAKAR